jgi:hypothetical protein
MGPAPKGPPADGPGGPPSGKPPAGAAAKPPPCECPLPADGEGYFGKGASYVRMGCACENA